MIAGTFNNLEIEFAGRLCILARGRAEPRSSWTTGWCVARKRTRPKWYVMFRQRAYTQCVQRTAMPFPFAPLSEGSVVQRSCGLSLLAGLALCGACGAARGAIDIECRPVTASAPVGNVVRIGLFVVSDSPADQLLAATQIIVGWDPTYVRLAGADQSGAVMLLASGFPTSDPFGLNEANPPQDGLGIFIAFAPFGAPVAATPSGALLTTLLFEAVAETPATLVELVERAGMPEGRTTVFDGVVPNRDVTGELGGPVEIAVVSPTCGTALLFGVPAAVCRRRRPAWNGASRA